MLVEGIVVLFTLILIIFSIIGLIRPTSLHQKIVIGKMDFGKKSWNLVPLLLGYLLFVTFSPVVNDNEKLLLENKQIESKIAKLVQTKKELEKREAICVAENKKREIEIDDIEKKVMDLKMKKLADDDQDKSSYYFSSSSDSYKSSRSKSSKSSWPKSSGFKKGKRR